MKIGGLMARTVPELHRMNWNQLLRAWSASTGWSNNKIYLHLLLVLACSSVLFNLSLRALGGSLFIYLPMVALAFLLCLLLPAEHLLRRGLQQPPAATPPVHRGELGRVQPLRRRGSAEHCSALGGGQPLPSEAQRFGST